MINRDRAYEKFIDLLDQIEDSDRISLDEQLDLLESCMWNGLCINRHIQIPKLISNVLFPIGTDSMTKKK